MTLISNRNTFNCSMSEYFFSFAMIYFSIKYTFLILDELTSLILLNIHLLSMHSYLPFQLRPFIVTYS